MSVAGLTGWEIADVWIHDILFNLTFDNWAQESE